MCGKAAVFFKTCNFVLYGLGFLLQMSTGYVQQTYKLQVFTVHFLKSITFIGRLMHSIV